MDDADMADRHNEILTRAHGYQSRKNEPNIIANGYCHHCGAAVGESMRWCDADCRDDWQHENE